MSSVGECRLRVKTGRYCNQTAKGSSVNTANPAISLAANYAILLLIGPPARALINSTMYHLGEGTRRVRSPLRVTEAQGD